MSERLDHRWDSPNDDALCRDCNRGRWQGSNGLSADDECPVRLRSALDARTRERDAARAEAGAVPRHLWLALANAQEAFERDDVGALGTINEDIQGLCDAALAWGRRHAARETAAQAAHAERLRGVLEALEARCGSMERGLNDACLIAQIHGRHYTGPTWDAEREAARAALAATPSASLIEHDRGVAAEPLRSAAQRLVAFLRAGDLPVADDGRHAEWCDLVEAFCVAALVSLPPASLAAVRAEALRQAADAFPPGDWTEREIEHRLRARADAIEKEGER